MASRSSRLRITCVITLYLASSRLSTDRQDPEFYRGRSSDRLSNCLLDHVSQAQLFHSNSTYTWICASPKSTSCAERRYLTCLEYCIGRHHLNTTLHHGLGFPNLPCHSLSCRSLPRICCLRKGCSQAERPGEPAMGGAPYGTFLENQSEVAELRVRERTAE